MSRKASAALSNPEGDEFWRLHRRNQYLCQPAAARASGNDVGFGAGLPCFGSISPGLPPDIPGLEAQPASITGLLPRYSRKGPSSLHPDPTRPRGPQSHKLALLARRKAREDLVELAYGPHSFVLAPHRGASILTRNGISCILVTT